MNNTSYNTNKDLFHKRKRELVIRDLITSIVEINSLSQNIDVVITSEKTRKTITVMENSRSSFFGIGQFFKYLRRNSQYRSNIQKTTWEKVLQLELLSKVGADISFTKDIANRKSYTIVFQ